jgi:3-oxoadipate enol-lactonase
MPATQVEVPGGRLFVVDDGTGPPIVLLHAGVADLRAWDGMVPALVDAGHRAIRYDARGFGRSTTRDVEFSPRDDLIAVLDALRIERAALVGNSLGGMHAFDTAIERPERVVAVVGVGAGLGGFDVDPAPEELPIVEAYERIDQADPFDAVALTEFEVQVWGNGPGQPSDRLAPPLRQSLYEMGLPLNRPERVAGRRISLEPAAEGRLADLRCPILAVAGELDFSEVVATARHLEAAAPNARALIWDDVAHMIGMERPDRLAAAIVEFLAPLRPWA